MRRIKRAELTAVRVALVNKQGGKCPLCGESLLNRIRAGDVCVDHDHKSGLIRGALCRACNGIEGKVHNLVTRVKRDGSVQDWLHRLLMYYTGPHTPLLHPDHKTEDEKRDMRNAKARARRLLKKEAGND